MYFLQAEQEMARESVDPIPIRALKSFVLYITRGRFATVDYRSWGSLTLPLSSDPLSMSGPAARTHPGGLSGDRRGLLLSSHLLYLERWPVELGPSASTATSELLTSHAAAGKALPLCTGFLVSVPSAMGW